MNFGEKKIHVGGNRKRRAAEGESVGAQREGGLCSKRSAGISPKKKGIVRKKK